MIKNHWKKCIWFLVSIVLLVSSLPFPEAFSVELTEHDDYIASLQSAGFPVSYCEPLWELHCTYPEWQFEVFSPTISWQDALSRETKLGVSLVSSTADSSWKSTQEGAYNWNTNTWVILDTGGWVAASEAVVAYYMDPRNFLDENSVFQFLDQRFDGERQNEDGLRSMVAGTYLCNDSIDLSHPDGNTSYISTIFSLCETNGVSPYVIASILIQEQGGSGESESISGINSRYPGIYNYFNIGAYATDTMTAVTRGLWYASGGNNGSTSNGRPWNTRYRALSGGILFYSKNYFDNGQTTFYLKRFNVQGMKPCTNQYMTNISGAYAEGKTLSKAYTGETRTSSLRFSIPVYSGMPETVCIKPGGTGSVNSKLASLSVEGVELSPSFNRDILEYTAIVSADKSSVIISAQPCDSAVSPSGTGEKTMNTGLNDFIISLTASNGSVTNYVLHISRRETEEVAAEQTETPASEQSNEIVEENKEPEQFEQQPTDIPAGEQATEGAIPVNTSPEYQKGDVSGDGTVMINDLIRIRNHLLGSETLSGAAFSAADIDCDGSVLINDLIRLRNCLLGSDFAP